MQTVKVEFVSELVVTFTLPGMVARSVVRQMKPQDAQLESLGGERWQIVVQKETVAVTAAVLRSVADEIERFAMARR